MIERFLLNFTKNANTIFLPVNPEKLPTANPGKNSTYNVLGIGDIVVPRTPGLRTIKISSYFPARVTSAVIIPSKLKTPEFYINFFRSAMIEKTPILYAPARYDEAENAYMTDDKGFYVVVESFDIEERGGETGDFYYDLTLTEYRDYSPQEMEIQTTFAAATVTTTNTTPTNNTTKTTTKKTVKKASVKSTRSTGDKIVVGSTCIANGGIYETSYGGKAYTTASNRRVTVKRISTLSGRAPYLIASTNGTNLGWIAVTGLKKVK